jgi:hypothetical protein
MLMNHYMTLTVQWGSLIFVYFAINKNMKKDQDLLLITLINTAL